MQKYGIIAGISNPHQVKFALNKFSMYNMFHEQKIEVVIVNGDLSSYVLDAKVPEHLSQVFTYLGNSEFYPLFNRDKLIS